MHALYPDPVLTVEDGRVGSFLRNELGLASMWRASDFLENGKRLENLSWRLWNHETLHLTRSKSNVAALNPSISSSSSTSTTSSSSNESSALITPALSNSAESIASIESHDMCRPALAATSLPLSPRPRKLLLERQVTPVDLDNLVHSIKEKQNLDGPLSPLPSLPADPRPEPAIREPARPSSPRPVGKHDSTKPTTTTRTTTADSVTSAGSATSGASVPSSHSVVRGFTPGTGVSSYMSKTQLAAMPAPILKSSSGSKGGSMMVKKKGGMFLLGGSSGDDDFSLRERMSPRSQQTALAGSPRTKKQTSFKEEVTEIKTAKENIASAVFDSDDEDEDEDEYEDEDELSEDVFDEDDEDAWEDDDAAADDGERPAKQLNFQRIDSTANLTSRRSQLTLAFERSASQANLQRSSNNNNNNWSTPTLRRSRTSTPNGPSIPASPEDDDEDGGSPLQMRVASRPRQIQTTTNAAEVPARAIPNSPRTTRQRMLAGEMTESFRKQLLWERKQRNVYTTNSSAAGSGGNGSNGTVQMRRAHTALDMPNMARGPPKEVDATSLKEQKLSLGKAATGVRGVHWNHYFDNDSMAGYHQKGW